MQKLYNIISALLVINKLIGLEDKVTCAGDHVVKKTAKRPSEV